MVSALPISEYIVFHDGNDGTETIVPANLFPLLVRPSRVGDPYFIDTRSSPCDFSHDFRLKRESILLDGDGIEKIAPEHLITGFDIGEVQVGEHIGEQRYEPIPGHVPKVEDSVWSSALETRGKDDISAIFKDRREQRRIISWVV